MFWWKPKEAEYILQVDGIISLFQVIIAYLLFLSCRWIQSPQSCLPSNECV